MSRRATAESPASLSHQDVAERQRRISIELPDDIMAQVSNINARGIFKRGVVEAKYREIASRAAWNALNGKGEEIIQSIFREASSPHGKFPCQPDRK